MLVGMGELASTTAELFAMGISARTGKSVIEAREYIWYQDKIDMSSKIHWSFQVFVVTTSENFMAHGARRFLEMTLSIYLVMTEYDYKYNAQGVVDACRLVDEKGLVTRERQDRETIEEYKIPYMHSGKAHTDLYSAVQNVKPEVLIGYSNAISSPGISKVPEEES